MTTKQDLLNKIEGVREITDASFPYVYMLSLEKMLFDPTFKENDTITVGNHTFIFKDSPNTIYEVQIGDNVFESFSNFFETLIEIVPETQLGFGYAEFGILSKYNNININIESVDGIVLNLFNNGCLIIETESPNFNPVEGDILTIGDTTYTFKETPVESFDIQIGGDNSTISNFYLFLTNTPNSDVFLPIIISPSLGNIFCIKSPDKFYASFPIKEFAYPQAQLKTLDVDKLNIIKPPDTESLFFSLPKKVNSGKTVTLINNTGYTVAVFDTDTIISIGSPTAGWVPSNTLAKFIYIDSYIGWLRLFSNNTVVPINEEVGI